MGLSAFELEIFQNILSSVAEEMGTLLVRAAFSPNIKERRDLSCGIFDSEGNMIAQAAHIPVHLGSMGFAVKSVMGNMSIEEGDILVVNDPFKGGTHLPDITCIKPLFFEGKLEFFAASRAHHADVGGKTPGSMPLSTSIHEEGIVIPPNKLFEKGALNEDLLNDIVQATRDPEEREGDFRATIASLELGEKRMAEVCAKYSISSVKEAAEELLNYSERLMREYLRTIPKGAYTFSDFMEDDGAGNKQIPIKATITIEDRRAVVDLTGTSKQVRGCINAPLSVTTAAVLYVFECLAPGEMPLNSGPLRAIEIIAPRGSLLNAEFPAAVAAGNCETSQRVVDVVMGALAKAIPERIPAASTGTMNNITFGGFNEREGREFAYYETIGGGMGGRYGSPGPSAKHTHMTNTLNTPVEALERELPIMIDAYSIRRGSGGDGRFRGGDGIIRSFKFLTNATVTIITERRVNPPYGISGGSSAKPGKNIIIKDGIEHPLPAKAEVEVASGDTLRIETPGGGGWGKKP